MMRQWFMDCSCCLMPSNKSHWTSSTTTTTSEGGVPQHLIDIDHRAGARMRTEAPARKLLLLGTGESGKSTIQKQMQLLFGHSGGVCSFHNSIREQYRQIVRRNTCEALQSLVMACHRFGWQWETDEQSYSAYQILLIDTTLPDFWNEKTMVHHIRLLWGTDERSSETSLLRRAFELRSQFQVTDAAAHFFSRIASINTAHYLPTDGDILLARLRTSGIVDTTLHIDRLPFRFLDCGGQRSERRKWIQCFSDCDALLYCAAINEYDQKMYEDGSKNRLLEALEVFTDIVNTPYFKHSAIILFLNKMDLFQDKIAHTDLNVCFQDYHGGKNVSTAMQFIAHKFVDAVPKDCVSRLFVHFTVATDTANIERIWRAVRQVIVQRDIKGTPTPGQ